MSNYQMGHAAEVTAAEYLKAHSFSIRELNWKTRLCEIDIVAEKGRTVYFIEVKSRKSSRQGYGYEYVTPKKLQQMRFAAEMWIQEHGWSGQYQLSVLSIDAEAVTFFESLDG